MSKSLDHPLRSPDDLRPAERARLEEAHARLRNAAKAIEKFRGGELPRDRDIAPVNSEAMAAAYAEAKAAEEDLWALREEMLGWHRPNWSPPATLVADWFCEEDEIYDTIDDPQN